MSHAWEREKRLRHQLVSVNISPCVRIDLLEPLALTEVVVCILFSVVGMCARMSLTLKNCGSSVSLSSVILTNIHDWTYYIKC